MIMAAQEQMSQAELNYKVEAMIAGASGPNAVAYPYHVVVPDSIASLEYADDHAPVQLRIAAELPQNAVATDIADLSQTDGPLGPLQAQYRRILQTVHHQLGQRVRDEMVEHEVDHVNRHGLALSRSGARFARYVVALTVDQRSEQFAIRPAVECQHDATKLAVAAAALRPVIPTPSDLDLARAIGYPGGVAQVGERVLEHNNHTRFQEMDNGVFVTSVAQYPEYTVPPSWTDRPSIWVVG